MAIDEKIKRTIGSLKKNNIKAAFAKSPEQAAEMALAMICKEDRIGMGGSMTLKQIGLIDSLKKEGYNLLDWVYEKNTEEEKTALLKESLTADVFLTGTNAISQDGKLINKDGRGNRLAALVYGPEKVIVIAGKNKIVKNSEEGLRRIENIAGPLNSKRLNKKTPCVLSGKCEDCSSIDRICRHTVITERQMQGAERINVIIIDGEYGL